MTGDHVHHDDVGALGDPEPLTVARAMPAMVAISVIVGIVVVRMARGAFQPLDGLHPSRTSEFLSFQYRYLAVFLLCSFSDWLKGPYVYALYEEYGFSPHQISMLFVGGFLSSLIFGTVVGSWSDKLGRRFMCLVFCVVYAASAFTKPINSFALLFIGRALSGVATSLLFTAFESWMVTEHHARGFPPELLTNTFSKQTLGNGVAAVLAGFVAQGAAHCCGYAAPFLVAVPCLSLAGILILPWKENYGNQETRVMDTLSRGLAAVRSDASLLALGVNEALFEATIYIWVFYWTPMVSNDEQRKDTPFGILFAGFMGAFMVGGVVPDLFPRSIMAIAFWIHVVSAVSLAASAVLDDKTWVFVCFALYEGAVGMYFPTHGTLRSGHVPDATRSAVMSVFRFPMNLMVVCTLQLGWAPRTVMMSMAVVQCVALVALRAFQSRAAAVQQHKQDDDDGQGGAAASAAAEAMVSPVSST